MHIIACGIYVTKTGESAHHERQGEFTVMSLKMKCFLLINETILVNIVEFIHS